MLEVGATVMDSEPRGLPALLGVVNAVNKTVAVMVTGDATLQLKHRRAYVYVRILVLANGS